jgi:hypothetical protein
MTHLAWSMAASGARLGNPMDTFIAAVVGAIVGGIFAIVGGYLAAHYTIEQEKKAREQDQFEDFVAAVRVVRYELAANTATLDSYLQLGGQLVHELHDSQFRAVQLVIARRLPEALRVQLIHTYGMLPFATGNVQNLAAGTSSNPAAARGVIQSVRDELASTGLALAQYLVNDLKVAMA